MEWFYQFGRRMAEWLGIADWFHAEVGYAAFGMSILLFVFFAFCGWLAIRKTRKTRAALSKIARKMDWSFKPKDNSLMAKSFFGLPLFQRGSWSGVRNVFSGKFEEAEFTLFEFWYKIKDMPSNHYLVAAFFLNGQQLPEFQLSHESVARKNREKLDYKIIDFESDPGFSKKYTLMTPNEETSRQLFPENIRSFFKNRPRHKTGSLAGRGNWLLFYQSTPGYMGRATEDYLRDIQGCLKSAFETYRAFLEQRISQSTRD